MKKFNFRRLKFNTWFYFLIFTAIIIACIWVFQFAFLDWYYTSAKFSTMREYGVKLTKFEEINEYCR